MEGRVSLSWQAPHGATIIGAFELLRAGYADVSAFPRPNLLREDVRIGAAGYRGRRLARRSSCRGRKPLDRLWKRKAPLQRRQCGASLPGLLEIPPIRPGLIFLRWHQKAVSAYNIDLLAATGPPQSGYLDSSCASAPDGGPAIVNDGAVRAIAIIESRSSMIVLPKLYYCGRSAAGSGLLRHL
jgi:hypothetical protein